MKFVNLNRKIAVLDRGYSQTQRYATPKKKRGFKGVLRVLVILIIIAVIIYIPTRGVYSSSRQLINSARNIKTAFKNENLDDIKSSLDQMKNSSDSLKTALNFLFWVRIIPFLGDYYGDINHFSTAAGYELTASQTLVNSLLPYKNELGFTGHPTPGQDKITQLVKILDKVNPKLDEIEPQLKKASDEVSSIDVNKYPEKIGKYQLRSQIDAAKNLIMGAHGAITQGRSAINIAPSALGEPTPKNYLIIFQNDKELRATGGFMTAYAFLTLDKGHVDSSSSDDIYRLDEKLLKTCLNVICPLTPPEAIVKYLPEANGKLRSAWSMRDSNLSPDLPTSMQEFEKLYSFLPDGEKFDGIITIDTHVVEELIKITGPVEVFGTKYSADNDSRCNCPNVIYELENYAQIIEKGEEDRKAILGALMQQILARSLSASSEHLPEFINAGVKLASAKDIMFYMHDQKVQQALSQLNWTGEINKDFKGDYLHINDSNFAGGKSNIYVTENVTLEINTDSTGKVKHKLTINYKNPQPYNTWLNGINRDYVRIYAPKGSSLMSSKGSEEQVTTKEDSDLNKTYFEAFVQIRPGNSNVLSFEYELPNSVSGKELPLLIQKQPGTKAFDYTIKVNGKTQQIFQLDSDKEFKLAL
ncbi:DUF4012 domain-containing protein [Candidatus Daviesbacteria bacterium]|nr:DUF4012 domain-containing protein [Candidatus Daviesbacteria bacterium]